MTTKRNIHTCYYKAQGAKETSATFVVTGIMGEKNANVKNLVVVQL